jgi:2-keto-4-pentenoate hydratase
LACTMVARGQGLRAGEVILSGALGPMVPCAAGELITAQIGALGSVSCRMV